MNAIGPFEPLTARRIGAELIDIDFFGLRSMTLTDTDALALLNQLRVALAQPAPAMVSTEAHA